MNQPTTLEEQEPPKQETNTFLSRLESLSDVEEKLRSSIHFMREALAQKGTPNFKGFWEIRKICLPLFKEPLAGIMRAQLWAEYIELTREGRRLKNILDEESAFAVEQIELAIVSLEKEATEFHENRENALAQVLPVDFPLELATLKERYAFYQNLQKQLNVLNVYASRINSLRKELIRTEMRIRQKNQFFQRLSQLGDKVFPVRKELIREVSEAFIQDVEDFVQAYFSSEAFSHEEVRRSVFFFRDEIKGLQAMAKMLTLNTHAFSATREQLSQCWDKLKGMEKELKKEYAQQKQQSSENVEAVQTRIQAFVADYAEGKYTVETGLKELESISRWMRDVDLTRPHVRFLKEELEKARQPIDAIQNAEVESRRQKQVEFEQARREKVEQLKQEVEAIAQTIASEHVEILLERLEECRKAFAGASMMKVERQQLDRKIKEVRDLIAEKQEQALIDLSDDDRATFDGLKGVLEQRKERRKAVKAQIEEYRKTSSGSGLDFEKAMRVQELMQEEKERLAKLDEGIDEIEAKISAFKSKS
ncbi:MAG: hypothetical protein S4CHLAM2_10760 [Chlamydiales bacterium]|nr:hypothetical protein [Chlamydiales bacterium]